MSEQCFLYDKCNHVHCADNFCLRKYKTARIYENSLIPLRLWAHRELVIDRDGTDFEAFTKLASIEKNIADFIKDGSNLYIYSATCGNGKTSWSLRLAESYANKVWPKATTTSTILFISVPTLILKLKENISSPNEYARKVLDEYLSADLVIWDDIATKTATQFELDHLLKMINDRINAGKTNIYTSNVNIDNLASVLDERLASRIRNSIVIELRGKDKRQLGVKEEY